MSTMTSVTTFTDAEGHSWNLRITAGVAERVKLECQDVDGKPLDLFAIAETGRLQLIQSNYSNLVRLVFYICLPDVLREFDLKAWDDSQAALYSVHPELRVKPITEKAFLWFCNRLDGEAVSSAIEALGVALINFFPDATLREHQLKCMIAEKEAKAKALDLITEKITKPLAKKRAK